MAEFYIKIARTKFFPIFFEGGGARAPSVPVSYTYVTGERYCTGRTASSFLLVPISPSSMSVQTNSFIVGLLLYTTASNASSYDKQLMLTVAYCRTYITYTYRSYTIACNILMCSVVVICNIQMLCQTTERSLRYREEALVDLDQPKLPNRGWKEKEDELLAYEYTPLHPMNIYSRLCFRRTPSLTRSIHVDRVKS